MNLNNLKPAWQRFRLLNSMQRFDQQEILLMLEDAEVTTVGRIQRPVVITIIFIALTFFCKGG